MISLWESPIKQPVELIVGEPGLAWSLGLAWSSDDRPEHFGVVELLLVFFFGCRMTTSSMMLL